jgi:diacylglycerol kinase (ATP)
VRAAFADHEILELDLARDVREQVEDAASVLVAGGDGTLGMVMRALAGTRVLIGLLPVGTYNNFARSLGIPDDLDAAIEVVRTGRPRPVTLGRVNGTPFLEVAVAGLFGELIAIGEAAKDRAFGELGEHFRHLAEAREFRFELTGDLEMDGVARSLVFSNTPTTGAHVPVGDGTPDDPYLELALSMSSARGMLEQIGAALTHQPGADTNVRFRRLSVRTDPPVSVYADVVEVGRTPVTVEADPGAVTVIEPA